jgi:hypothetical protein
MMSRASLLQNKATGGCAVLCCAVLCCAVPAGIQFFVAHFTGSNNASAVSFANKGGIQYEGYAGASQRRLKVRARGMLRQLLLPRAAAAVAVTSAARHTSACHHGSAGWPCDGARAAKVKLWDSQNLF